MNQFLISSSILIIITVSFLTVTESAEQDTVYICAYSMDPSQYDPSCYKCPKIVYPNALLACVNVTEMPKNITYKQAGCLEKNCKISYPTPTQSDMVPEQLNSMPNLPNLYELFTKWMLGGKMKRSVDNNNLEDTESLDHSAEVVKVLVVNPPLKFEEPEYM